ncbi:cysteine-rich receptor-like protein kinase [Trifolium pratense]|uniref:Cysteine-rich receptor-like protein kinase n=1 Tax=Trifolium pratense TaxID=57577 RepID=A0A2K3L379_TRIPR|nr:cysteine-rich receptor-like protein kinase [Trifolium pratense]
MLCLEGEWGEESKIVNILNVYAPCESRRKRNLWLEIRNTFLAKKEERWCILGDFNAIREESERRGISEQFRRGDMEDFDDFISEAELIDLPLHGRRFTWAKAGGSSMSRIDRFLISEAWSREWPKCKQWCLDKELSDHCPIMLCEKEQNWGPKPFRMLSCWKETAGYHKYVREQWNDIKVEGWGMYVLKEKFKLIKVRLKEWHKRHTQNLEAKIKEAKEDLKRLEIKGELGGLSEEEANTWRERASQSAVVDHFQKQFSAKGARPIPANMSFKCIENEIKDDMVREFSEEEVRKAVWECESTKSPGPDGVNFGFVKEFWEDMKDDFMRVMREFHENGRIVRGANSSFIVLIPKKKNPLNLSEFRPISLIGCIYKVIAKVLANRLKTVIDTVISETQSAFISGRQILDGILIANEIVDEAKRKKKDVLMFKVDFEKAYDSVDWSFLDFVMQKMNFHEKWRRWISECLKTASVSVLVNGSATKEFEMGRGLRQGDPLSPFLFIIISEGFNILMKKAVESSRFIGYKFEGGDVCFSHLQYADDTLIIGRKGWGNIRIMKANLLLLQLMSGLKVNFNKSMLVGINICQCWLEEAASILNCKVGCLPFKYLGLPIDANPRRVSTWKPVIDTVRSRLSKWKHKRLSIGGRVVILKSVLSAIPVYFLSFFKAPTDMGVVMGSLEAATMVDHYG